MQEQLSEILDNILGLLLLEGSYDIHESEEDLAVSIQTKDAGRLIGFRGESLEALQNLVNQMLVKKSGEFKRVIIDVGEWRKNKEAELAEKAQRWAQQVTETDQLIELEPMPSWQRRIIHITVQGFKGVESESIGEGRDRHLVIKPKN